LDALLVYGEMKDRKRTNDRMLYWNMQDRNVGGAGCKMQDWKCYGLNMICWTFQCWWIRAASRREWCVHILWYRTISQLHFTTQAGVHESAK